MSSEVLRSTGGAGHVSAGHVSACADGPKGDRIAGFDGVRAVAFLLVFISHGVPGPKTEMAGSLGVWLFFVLSGFLITRNLYALRLRMEASSVSYGSAVADFYLRRSARIFPAYYGLLLALLAASPFVKLSHFGPSEIIAYLTYTTNFYVSQHGWVGRFGHLWSLAVEEQYYLLFAPVALAFASYRLRAVCFWIVAFGAATNVWLVSAGSTTTELDVNSMLGFGLLGLGGLAGLSVNQPGRSYNQASMVIGVVGLIYICMILMFPTFHDFCSFGRIGGVLAAVLLTLIYRNQSASAVWILESFALRRLGEISYGCYLVHHFVSFAVVEPSLGHALGSGTAAFYIRLALELLATVVVAQVSWTFFEKPIRDWCRARLRRV